MTRKIFRSLFLVAMTALLSSLSLTMAVLYTYFTQVQVKQLRVETALASHALTNEGIRYFDKLDDTMDCRITWIDTDGTVLYDNRSDSVTMENHLEREEVRDALISGYGESTRYSDTLMERFLYAAERLPDGTVLRLADSQHSVLTLVLDMWGHIAIVITVTVTLSLALANRLSRRIVQPLNDLNLDMPLVNKEYEEIRPLLYRLSSQQEQLQLQSQELKLRQKEFSTVTSALSEGLVLISGFGTIMSINPAAARLLEVTPNCAGADFSVANTNKSVTELVEQALAGEKQEQVLRFHQGAYLTAARPVYSEGKVSGVVLLLLDVTQQKKAEELRREFTANVSHELKTPLHTISGYAELMKNGMVQPEDIPGFSEKIYQQAQRMTRLVEDILRLSRLDAGAADRKWEETDVYAMAQSTVVELLSAAELKNVALELKGSPAVIYGIPQLIGGILFNLIDNAIKYNRDGGYVLVCVEAYPDAVVLQVADTGIGIPEEDWERIFERFYRVDKSHSKEVGGTGLGLSIVKHAAKILGAELKLDSTEGKGTTVTVRFEK